MVYRTGPLVKFFENDKNAIKTKSGITQRTQNLPKTWNFHHINGDDLEKNASIVPYVWYY